MHLSHHKINELKNERESGRARHHKGVFYYMRHFWYLYPDKSGEKDSIGQWHIETILRKPTLEFAFRFHVGNAGSETPFDGHLKLFGSAIYWGMSFGRKLAQKITERPDSKYNGKDISLWNNREDDHLYVTLWRDQNGNNPRKRGKDGRLKRDWRDRAYPLNPMEWIYGPKRYSYEDIDSVETTIDMPEGSYPVTLKLQKCSYGRTKSKGQKEISYSIDVDAPKGIPSHYDKSGGWKGDRTYGFGVNYPGHNRVDWKTDAKNLVTAWVFKQRGRTGFREPQEQE